MIEKSMRGVWLASMTTVAFAGCAPLPTSNAGSPSYGASAYETSTPPCLYSVYGVQCPVLEPATGNYVYQPLAPQRPVYRAPQPDVANSPDIARSDDDAPPAAAPRRHAQRPPPPKGGDDGADPGPIAEGPSPSPHPPIPPPPPPAPPKPPGEQCGWWDWCHLWE
jgi:hypothetical protein